jgi:O-antigen ligase
LTGIIISLLAIYQYFFGFQHISVYITKQNISDPFALDYITRKRVFFPFVTPNTLSGYLSIIILLALIRKDRIWLVLPLSFALLLTKSLGAFISIFLALVIYFYLQGKLNKKRILLLFGLLLIMGLVFMARSTNTKQYLRPIFSTMMRLNYWKETLGIIKTKPLTGVGLGNFNLIHSRFAHNSYLQIWAEMGILGIISILCLITATLKSALKNFKVSPYKNQIAILICANIVFLIHNFIDFTFFLPEVAIIWWIILGLNIP